MPDNALNFSRGSDQENIDQAPLSDRQDNSGRAHPRFNRRMPDRRRSRVGTIAVIIVVVTMIVIAPIFYGLGQTAGDLLIDLFGNDSPEEGEVFLHAPTPFAPKLNDEVYTLTPTLIWVPIPNADSYQVHISDDPSFPSPIMETVTRNELNITQPMEEDTTYYWKVRAVYDTSIGNWSEVSYFNTNSQISVPIPCHPADGSTINGNLSKLNWEGVDDADRYRVQLSLNANFTHLLLDIEIEQTEVAPPISLQEGSKGYWRVQACNDEIRSEWSPVSCFNIGSDSFNVEFQWTYSGQTWTYSDIIDGNYYYSYRDKPRTYDFASYVIFEDEFIRSVAEYFDREATGRGYSTIQKAELVLAFVQSIPYQLDEESTGYIEYPRYPVETLVDGVGDCEDKAALYAAIMQADPLNIDAVLLMFTKSGSSGHMATGIWGSGLDGTYYDYNGRTYYYCETTANGWKIGQQPTQMDDYECQVLPC